MNNLIHLLKGLYAYCTDFIINLSNIAGLSYYEVNFVVFIIIYPLFLFVSAIIFIYQKSKLRNFKRRNIATTKTKSQISFKNIKTFNKRKIFITANIAWLIIIVIGTSRVLSESTNYYSYHLSRGDYPPEADSISIPIFRETFFAFLILSILQIFLNIFIFLTTQKTNLPTKLFIKADFFIIPVVLWELFFGFWILASLFLFIYWFWIGYYIEDLIILFFTFLISNLRAGQISKYKKSKETANAI
ncbi:MAG: hypothetical protein U0V72_11590 [Cytophagales bacterium]